MTDKDIQSLIVPETLHGLRIDAALAMLMPDYSRSQLTTWLKQGLITVDGNLLKPKDKVVGGEKIHCSFTNMPDDRSLLNCQPENIPLDIVYEDEELLVINKPAGLVVHPGAGNSHNTLMNALLHYLPQSSQLPRAGIVHRLDKDTTGLLVIAKSIMTHTYLIREMQDRAIKRKYIALVQGHLISSGEINTFFGRHPRNRLKMAVCKHGKEAITHYSIQQHYPGFTLLDIELFTGRTHQIRVHMTHINHPIVGDPLYGTKLKRPKEMPDELVAILNQFQRQALHAQFLSLTHPISKEFLTFEAPLPDDFQHLLQALDDFLEISTT